MADVVLVTGASGFIATHVVKQLLEAGEYQVRGTVRSKENELKVKPLLNLVAEPKHPLDLVEADLTKDEGWLEAVQGCSYVLHIASPLPPEVPRNEDDIIRPAVDGVLRVLKACSSAGGVKRVVLTSSTAAITGGFNCEGKFNEENWTDVDNTEPYPKSKTLAERAAWNYVKEHADFELVVLNPALVVGPALCGPVSLSQEPVRRLLERVDPMVVRINWPTIDVRNVAQAHIRAMTIPEAVGHRHILAAENYWHLDTAKVLHEEFGRYGYRVPTTQAPNAMIKLFSIFDKQLRIITPGLGKYWEVDTSRMRNVLGITELISVKQSYIDMAYSMIESGKIRKSKLYIEKGPFAKASQPSGQPSQE